MHSRDFSGRPGGQPDLGETRRRFLFAREHLAAHAPGARPQRAPAPGARSRRRDGGSAVNRTGSKSG
jgi:hypothetical protein